MSWPPTTAPDSCPTLTSARSKLSRAQRYRCSRRATITPPLSMSGGRSDVADWRGRYEEWAQARGRRWTRAPRRQTLTRLFALEGAPHGARPADEALRALDGFRPEVPTPGLQLTRAWLLAMLGRFEEAWRSSRTPPSGGPRSSATTAYTVLAELATLAGDHEAAARYLRTHCDELEGAGNVPSSRLCAPPRTVSMRARALRGSRVDGATRPQIRQRGGR